MKSQNYASNIQWINLKFSLIILEIYLARIKGEGLVCTFTFAFDIKLNTFCQREFSHSNTDLQLLLYKCIPLWGVLRHQLSSRWMISFQLVSGLTTVWRSSIRSQQHVMGTCRSHILPPSTDSSWPAKLSVKKNNEN